MERTRRFIRGAGLGLVMFALPAWAMGHYYTWSLIPLGLVLLLPLSIVALVCDLLNVNWVTAALCNETQGVELCFFSASGRFYDGNHCSSAELAYLSLLCWCFTIGLYCAARRARPDTGFMASGVWGELTRSTFRRRATWLKVFPSLLALTSMFYSTVQNELALRKLKATPPPAAAPPLTNIVYQNSLVLPAEPFTLDKCLLATLEVRQGMDAESASQLYPAPEEQALALSILPTPWTLAKIQAGQLVMMKPYFSQLGAELDLMLLERLSLANPQLEHIQEDNHYALIRTLHLASPLLPGDLRCAQSTEVLQETQRDWQHKQEQALERFLSIPVPSGLTEQEQLAYRCLRNERGWGLTDGSGHVYSFPSHRLVAFLKLTQVSDANEVFQQLLRESTELGRYHALAALYRLNRPVFDAQLPVKHRPTPDLTAPRMEHEGEFQEGIWKELESGQATHQLWGHWETSEGRKFLNRQETLRELLAYQLIPDQFSCKVKKEPRAAPSEQSGSPN